MRTQRKFWSFRTVKSPIRSFRSLAGQFLVFQVLVVAVVLVAVAAVSVAQSTREFRDVRGQRMIAVAENMASTPIVGTATPTHSPGEYLSLRSPARSRS